MEALKCPGCGAPLPEPPAPGEYAACPFCGARSRTTTVTTRTDVVSHNAIVIRSNGKVRIGGDVVAGDLIAHDHTAHDLCDVPISHARSADGEGASAALSWLSDLARNRTPRYAPPENSVARLLRAWRRFIRKARMLFHRRPTLPVAAGGEIQSQPVAAALDEQPAGGVSLQGSSITIAGDLIGRDKVVNRRR